VFVLAFSVCPFVFPQQPIREETRPRRVQALKQPAIPVSEQPWKTAATQPVISLDTMSNELAESEPLIRIALATDARSGSISATGKLMNSTGLGTTFAALETTRVRVEPRLLSPLASVANETYGIAIDIGLSRSEAEQKQRELKEATDEEAQLVYDSQTRTWGLAINKSSSREEAEELVERLGNAGFDASFVPPKVRAESETKASNAAANSSGGLRLVSKASLPTREVVAFGPGSTQLISSSAPVLFMSDEDAKTPVRYNNRPYRGRIEVFTNTRGTLTIVNVLGLEDYVRGVVANELSPGSYPALDALKAQAIAARTYALRNRGQFAAQGFDLLPTTRSQVYRGLTSENPLSTRAVDETRGLVATFNGEPINALYTSTCGGRTEDSENIFNQAVPYLRGRECALETQQALAPFTLQTTRELPDVREEQHVSLTRELALLGLQSFSLTAHVSDSWLEAEATVSEVGSWLASVSRLSRQIAPPVTEEVNRPGPFATALSSAVYGESRADILLNSADVEYFLAIRDAADVPVNNRADVSALVRDGYLSVFPDATLRPRQPMSRARVLRAIARIVEARGLLQLQKGTARSGRAGELILRSTRGKDQKIRMSPDAFLFRQIADGLYPVRSVVVIGGEPVVFHTSVTGEVDYLEVRPAPNGAAAERFSPFTNWSTEVSLGQLQRRLARAAKGIGPLSDLRVAARGSSRRVTDLELIGTNGTAHIRGGRIRSALGLREQLFVIDRRYDDAGRVSSFSFSGRGWGHGVGMCQVGAYGLAKQGLTFDQILKTYYTGIEITRLY
jgi:stage II sporulation protein D